MTAMSVRIASLDSEHSPLQMRISVSSIDIPADHRRHHPDAIQAMAENMDLHGQQQPIEVVRLAEASDRYRLIFGSLRLQAVARLDWPMIDAIVKEADQFVSEAGMRLRSISENMLRNPLTALDRSVAIADWCAIYRAAQPPLKPGPKPLRMTAEELSLNFRFNSFEPELLATSDQFAASFSEAAQAFLNISRAGVFRALKIASIPSLQRDRIALHWLAKKEGELYALAAINQPERQAAVIDLILTEKAESVADAIDLLDQKPKSFKAKWEEFHDRFSRLQPADQDQFFDLNVASITRWQAKRGRK